MKKIAIIGTNGIPANYGGFETLVEYLVEYLNQDFEITVYCSGKSDTITFDTYKGAKLKRINLKANGWQSIFYDFISLLNCYKNHDKILILGCSGSIFQPLLNKHKHKFIMNLGGLDWKRSKWNYFTRAFLKLSEKLAIKYSGVIISDNLGIKKYLLSEYSTDSQIITYGGDQVFNVSPEKSDYIKYDFINKPYFFTVARIQADNNIEMLCDAFSRESNHPLVIVGNWSNSKYGVNIKKKYSNINNLILLDAIYDQRELNLLRSNCYVYIHGHSAGGTNPALVEAMNLGLAIFAYDNVFNRSTTEDRAIYFSSTTELKNIIDTLNDSIINQLALDMKKIASINYSWKKICLEYAELFKN